MVGAICLLLALYAFQLLPVNYAGLALIAARHRASWWRRCSSASFGSLGIGGLIAFVIGSVMLIDTDVPGFGIPCALIARLAAGERGVPRPRRSAWRCRRAGGRW